MSRKSEHVPNQEVADWMRNLASRRCDYDGMPCYLRVCTKKDACDYLEMVRRAHAKRSAC